MFSEIGVPKNSANFTGKQLYDIETPTQMFFAKFLANLQNF